ncbi:TetR/AcrR family transcriptional regulator [Frigoribacterium faeni]|uniref:AcrR family transcriptional regulator n=1 Tax=Frigoribacterium faeni TaxID=145483 RepID=A0A7W3JGY9_9MICO|nr:TetR/AcrR family transcriptional regulator [Frigoribacterium faeni]MBA8812628.1 AcrR family transcriptional regulator [Frigoribacterium faeni]BFF13733.1 TetR family transcriptional regulator [Microbacterium flavescens]GEK82359.1 TetR family transcriptional regulator [Frigoribacterium faeni]
MLVTDVNDALPGGSSLLRNEPVQARSSARLTGLLDAAASIIDEIGYERLTTAMVAERAGASIGTVYRYFPDRIAVVDALALRCIQRLSSRVADRVAEGDIGDWREAIGALIDAKAAMYRDEPGFRAIRFGDAPDLGAPQEAQAASPLADQITTLLAERFGVVRDEATELAIQVVVEIGNALLARAFVTGGDGDARFVHECRRVVTAYLEPVVTVR